MVVMVAESRIVLLSRGIRDGAGRSILKSYVELHIKPIVVSKSL